MSEFLGVSFLLVMEHGNRVVGGLQGIFEFADLVPRSDRISRSLSFLCLHVFWSLYGDFLQGSWEEGAESGLGRAVMPGSCLIGGGPGSLEVACPRRTGQEEVTVTWRTLARLGPTMRVSSIPSALDSGDEMGPCVLPG